METAPDKAEESMAVVLTTFPDLDTARQIGTKWVEAQLVACVNLLPGAESIYRWKDRTERSPEVLALVKTTQARLEELAASLHELHPYEVPEFVVLEPGGGSPGYLAWVKAACTTARLG